MDTNTFIAFSDFARVQARVSRKARCARLAAHYLTEARFWRRLALGKLNVDDAFEVIGPGRREKP